MPETLLTTKFRCPECRGPLKTRGGNALVCASCKSRVPVVDGIGDFVRGRFDTALNVESYEHDHAIDETQADSMYDLIRGAAGQRWPDSLGSVVEIGCGTGLYSRGLLTHHGTGDIVLTDVSLGMLRACWQNLDRRGLLAERSVAFATYSSHEACVRDAAFDSCVGTSVLHHIPDVGAFLTDIVRWLRPGGRAFFLEPSRRFFQALAQALADIAVLLMPAYQDHPVALQPLFNWLGYERRDCLHHNDIEFLSTLEDKHKFTPEQIASLGVEAGFSTSEAIPFGSDPTGIATARGLAREIGLDASLIDTVTQMMATVGRRYMSLLGQTDAAPQLLIWLTKQPDTPNGPGLRSPPVQPLPVQPLPVQPLPVQSLPDQPSPVQSLPDRPSGTLPRPEFAGVPPRCHLTVVAAVVDGRLELHVSGWCLSNLDVKWVRVRAQGEERDAPVWLPRPDVQRAVNPHGSYAAWNALCSGVDTRLSMGTAVPGDDGYAFSVSLVFVGGAVIDIATPRIFPGGEAVSLSI